ncbi:cation:proton antiporter [Marinivivus vitaminiproducens]|uniref:cation:proton antiporter n=1 Tax=Marinivivus vitaminiproducens TaxID=3035935 RepID=UPI002798A05E|nr:cation:proton antiporter [Geminicoccaceae bacterium SCSIO 64248]
METVIITVFGLAGLMVLIGLLPPVASRLRLPFTVLLAAFGCALGLGRVLLPPHLQVDVVGGMSLPSEAFLLLFLPVLLFETVLAFDTRDLWHDIAPILTMAVVAVLVSTLVAGFALSLVSSMGLIAACLLGAIVATTDPIAVVGIFRDVGAPKRLSTLVEGESLLNDAAAIALFVLLLDVLTGTNTSIAGTEIAQRIAWSLIGGALAGAVLGRIGSELAIRAGDTAAAAITISVAVPYLTYIGCERFLHVSGVVAVVVAGFSFSSNFRLRAQPSVWTALTRVWGQLAFWASSLIFLLAAMRSPATLGHLGVHDFSLLAVLVIATMVARALTLGTLLPALSWLGLSEPVDRRYQTIMLWGGLRGAVTLVLALALAENMLLPLALREQMAALAIGLVLFTLFVQAPTLRPLIHGLGVDRLSPTDQALRRRAFDLASANMQQRIEDIAKSQGIDAAEVASLRLHLASAPARDGEAGAAEREPPAGRLVVGLATLASQELAMAHQELESAMVSRRIAARLTSEAQALLDTVRSQGRAGYRRAAAGQLVFGRRIRLYIMLQRRLGWERPLANQLAERFEILTVRTRLLHRLETFSQQRLSSLLGAAAGRVLAGDLKERLDAVTSSLDALRLQYPAYARALEHSYLQRAAVRLEEQAYVEMYQDALISREILQDLRDEIDRRRRQIDRMPDLDLDLSVDELVRHVPLFEPLNDQQLATLIRLLRPRLAVPGEVLMTRGSRGDSMFFIGSGALEVAVEPEPIRLGTGAFVGELALLTRQPRSATVRSLTFTRLLVLEGDAFRRFVRAHPELREEILSVARERLGRALPEGLFPRLRSAE